MYVSKTCILKNGYERNVSIKHESLMKKTYLFELIQQRNEILKTYVSKVKIIITKKIDVILMTNLKKNSIQNLQKTTNQTFKISVKINKNIDCDKFRLRERVHETNEENRNRNRVK